MSESKKTRNTAVLVFHGMGQQVPFQTLGDLAKRILDRARQEKPPEGAEPLEFREPISVQTVPRQGDPRAADATLTRLRMTADTPKGAKNVDFYECYWAPIPEGKVNLVDVLVFLLGAGKAGLGYALQGRFTRWFWKSKREFDLEPWSFPLLLLTLLLIASLMALALGLGLVLAAHVLQKAAFALGAAAPGWTVKNVLLAPLTSIFNAPLLQTLQGELLFPLRLALLLALPFAGWAVFKARGAFWKTGSLLFFAFGLYHLLSALFAAWQWGWLAPTGIRNPQGWVLLLSFAAPWMLALAFRVAMRDKPSWPAALVWSNVAVLVPALLFTAAVAAVFLAVDLRLKPPDPDPSAWRLFFAASSLAETRGSGSRWLLLAYGAAGAGLFLFLRKFLIEYAGDVAAYISSHKVSKFSEIRSRIQDEAFKVVTHVFAAEKAGKKEYDQVVFVGHSLGSVIAYDSLNGAFNAEIAHGNGWRVADRTGLLLTFGSPLNKVAFIFRTQIEDNEIRESLAAAKQPMLEESHAFRPHRWVNVWSGNDIISGPLDLFDLGRVKLLDESGGRFRFAYDLSPPGREAAASMAKVAGNGEGKEPAASGREPNPVLPLIDPQANIPLAAHNQFWKNDLIYRILLQALRDKGDGEWLRQYFQVEASPA